MKTNIPTPSPIAIPPAVVLAGQKLMAKLTRENSLPWWFRDVPSTGIPVIFTGKGTIRAGIAGWIIDGHARTVYLGEAASKTEIGEFVVLVDGGGSQVLAQVGRDFDFLSRL